MTSGSNIRPARSLCFQGAFPVVRHRYGGISLLPERISGVQHSKYGIGHRHSGGLHKCRSSFQQGVDGGDEHPEQHTNHFVNGRRDLDIPLPDQALSGLRNQDSPLSSTIQDILKIAADRSLSEIEQIQLIRNALPPPLFPHETEPGMMGETRVAKSFGHLNDLLFLDGWGEHSDKLRPFKLYRGVPDVGMELLTSLQRLVQPTNHINTCKAGGAAAGAAAYAPPQVSAAALKRIEQGMIESFRKYSYGTARIGNDASLLEWMALAQHHGLPTRLLDWTKSPYVALHFATNKAHLMGVDSVVWVVDPYRYSVEHPSFRDYADHVAAAGGPRSLGVFSTAELQGFLAWRAGKARFAAPADADDLGMPFIFVEPPSLSRRVVNQWGCFALLRTGEHMEEVLQNMKPTMQDEINKGLHPSEAKHGHVFRKIIIPASLKQEVRDKLDAIGFTERTLFPGLDGLCSYLRRYYTPYYSSTAAGDQEMVPESDDDGDEVGPFMDRLEDPSP